jgi:precorrin-3B synthase
VLDDGRGDVVDLAFDLGYQAEGRDTGLLLVGSSDRGTPIDAADAVPMLLRLAREFTSARRRSGAWHVAELPAWVATLGLATVQPTRGLAAVPLGRVGDAASVSVRLARITLDQARLVESLTDGGPVVVTPWRGLVLPATAERLGSLAKAGFVTEERSAWAQLSACVGAPYCAKARIDTSRVAEALAASGVELSRTHVSGCERRCGAPTGAHVDLVAPTCSEALGVSRP